MGVALSGRVSERGAELFPLYVLSSLCLHRCKHRDDTLSMLYIEITEEYTCESSNKKAKKYDRPPKRLMPA